MTIRDCLKLATKELQTSCERPRFEAELLLSYHCIGKVCHYMKYC